MNEAIDVFFKEMIEIDRYKPNIFLYKVIIKYCVYSNNNEIAFEIFEQVNRKKKKNFSVNYFLYLN